MLKRMGVLKPRVLLRAVSGIIVVTPVMGYALCVSNASAAVISPWTTSMAVSHHTTGPSNPYIKPTPPYAKWGKLAVSETKKRFPQATIVDYLHVGRQVVSSSTSAEVFKLWLNEGSREFGVIVRILFDTNTEKVQDITFEKTAR